MFLPERTSSIFLRGVIKGRVREGKGKGGRMERDEGKGHREEIKEISFVRRKKGRGID